jgi:phosphoribosylformylglycinamidine synthase
VQIFRGVSAQSSFKKNKLLERLRNIDRSVSDVNSEFVHFVQTRRELSEDDVDLIKQLVDYGPKFDSVVRGQQFFVIPRIGTISPWSSKATDIAHNTGVGGVERIERGIAYYIDGLRPENVPSVVAILHDRMTETVITDINDAETLFENQKPEEFAVIPLLEKGEAVVRTANTKLGLALADDEIEYLVTAYQRMKRNPSDVELMMFAQVNSEHCRHKIFNAEWTIDGQKQPKSLFKMIKNTNEKGGEDVISAYTDNAAIIRGPSVTSLWSNPETGVYEQQTEPIHMVIKAETHNHPTAIAPNPGAATGTGGEIRDEAATGRGGRSKIGLSGYSVSNLEIPGHQLPWEKSYGKPERISSALDIILEAPIGAASFANEFGRPALTGYFRTMQIDDGNQTWGYHKPIMIAGGLGLIRDSQVDKKRLPVGTLVIVLGGPAMLIGLGGGAASSMESGNSEATLDYASVQRGNGEMERRAQEVINSCWTLGENSPILSIHDVGAGGLSNALPELVHDSDRGADFELRDIPCAEPGLSPLQIWCNEAQERYVLGIEPKDLDRFSKMCVRERCPFAVVGTITEEKQLVLRDRHFANSPVDIPMDVLFGKPPKMSKTVLRAKPLTKTFNTCNISINETVERVLRLPAVASKKFLITIGDRTVSGLVVRDQMVGPWQVPVADVAVTANSFYDLSGQAMAMGERTPLAISNAPAASRIAIAEAVLNIAAADVRSLTDIKLSANWMAAVASGMEDEKLFDAVKAVGEDFCPTLGITIPVGKDSLSMRSNWQAGEIQKNVTSPVSLIISAFAQVSSVEKTLTPELNQIESTKLLFVDLSGGHERLGGSALSQVYNAFESNTPDCNPETLKAFINRLIALKDQGLILAYHDRSDGGLFTTLAEMAFASRSGLDIDVTSLTRNPLQGLFNEELGVVLQVRSKDFAKVTGELKDIAGLSVASIGSPNASGEIVISHDKKEIYRASRIYLEKMWSETSYHLQKMRDNPVCADSEFELISHKSDLGLAISRYAFSLKPKTFKSRPKIAILRDEGVNGHVEMAAAFDRAGFTSVDVHLNDLISGKFNLQDFRGIAASGGFSYGDVLGAGEGWAKTILMHSELREAFSIFFNRKDTFTFGACNGCQMLTALQELIPGTAHWPKVFARNLSEQFEAREVLTKIIASSSILFKDMGGAILPVPIAHGEGRALYDSEDDLLQAQPAIVARYVDGTGELTDIYPSNPNGSMGGIVGVTSEDGRATILMPHAERAFLNRQLSWHPKNWQDDSSPWFKLFMNAREWVGEE